MEELLLYSATTCSGNMRCSKLLCSQYPQRSWKGKAKWRVLHTALLLTSTRTVRVGIVAVHLNWDTGTAWASRSVLSYTCNFHFPNSILLQKDYELVTDSWFQGHHQIFLSVNLKCFVQVRTMIDVVEFSIFFTFLQWSFLVSSKFFHWRNVWKKRCSCSVTLRCHMWHKVRMAHSLEEWLTPGSIGK